MSGPAEIWIDERVVRTMATGPDPDESPQGVKMIHYLSEERVAELLRQSTGGAEFFIQVTPGENQTLVGLTNFGRLFRKWPADPKWLEIDLPDLGVPAGS